ncbi:hypothetical protein E1180_04255 [Roseibium denhamense]|nr:hypothetical protein [Roseibium denhamense]
MSTAAPAAHPTGERVLYSTDLEPQFTAEYYKAEGYRYFDTLDSYASRTSKPRYAPYVLRWEWPPWLYLTGHKDHWMALDKILIFFPTEVVDRTCEAFKTQPFSRCRVTFHFKWAGDHVPIYEEFTFNDAGEITFVEVWSDEAGLRPMDPVTDYWAEAPGIARLSTRIPGLGNPVGRYNRRQLAELARADKELADLQMRMRLPVLAWTAATVRFLFDGYLRPQPASMVQTATHGFQAEAHRAEYGNGRPYRQ